MSLFTPPVCYSLRPHSFPKNDQLIAAVRPLLRPPSAVTSPRNIISRLTAVACHIRRMSSAAAGSVVFQLSPSSALKIQKGDITRWSVDGSSDAIVNPANEQMLGGGGADGAIHRAAGPELRKACFEVPEVRPGVRCPTGEARITPAFQLPASHVIHTVGPIYDTTKNPKASLRNAYRYPYDEAAGVAISTVNECAGDFKEVHFVLFSDETYDAWVKNANQLLQT